MSLSTLLHVSLLYFFYTSFPNPPSSLSPPFLRLFSPLVTHQVGRIGDKLKRTEEHLLRLLALRKQQGVVDRARARVGVGARRGGVSAATAASRAAAAAVAMAAAKGGQESGTASGMSSFFSKLECSVV